jgi:hypothetical protein
MSTPNAAPTVEDSIKTALDAADTAITVTREFDQVRNDYAKTRSEVKLINRQVMTVFVSSLVASTLAVAAGGLIYFRTLTEMETTNATSLEALVIFAENVDRLAAATTEANTQAAIIAELDADVASMQAMIAEIINGLDTQSEAAQVSFAALQDAVTGTVYQSASATIDELSRAIVTAQTEFAKQLEELSGIPESSKTAMTGSAGSDDVAEAAKEAPVDAVTPSSFAEIMDTLETMMMLQREISAKITALSTSPRTPARTAPAATPTPTPQASPTNDDMIKFP